MKLPNIFIWGCTLALVVVCATFLWLGITEKSRVQEDWDQWCLAQKGVITDFRHVPVNQLGSPIQQKYCLVYGAVAGAR